MMLLECVVLISADQAKEQCKKARPLYNMIAPQFEHTEMKKEETQKCLKKVTETQIRCMNDTSMVNKMDE